MEYLLLKSQECMCNIVVCTIIGGIIASSGFGGKLAALLVTSLLDVDPNEHPSTTSSI